MSDLSGNVLDSSSLERGHEDISVDYIFEEDKENKYLGHRKAQYGFVLQTGLGPNDKSTFILPLPPQSIEESEEAAVTIIPTQDGGKFIENNGNLFKDITLSGTTGFLPRANLAGVGDGSPINPLAKAYAQASGQPAGADVASVRSSVSGYTVFHKLRSLFRKYWQIHRTGTAYERQNCSLFYLNTKDNEVWLVEPLAFSAPRTSKSPLSYSYQIKLRTISKASGLVFTDWLAPVQPDSPVAVNILVQVQKALVAQATQLEASINNLVPTSVADYSNLVIHSVGLLATTLDSVNRGVSSVISMPSTAVAALVSNIDKVFMSAENLAVDLPMATLESLIQIRSCVDRVMATPSLFADNFRERWAGVTDDYNGLLRGFPQGITGNTVFNGLSSPGFTYDSSGVPTPALAPRGPGAAPPDYPPDSPMGSANQGLSVGTFNAGENPFQLAARLLGDPQRAYDIIAINNLSSPYFSQSQSDRKPGTLAPGDPVLLPVSKSLDSSTSINFKPRKSYLGLIDSFTPGIYSGGSLWAVGTLINSPTLPQWRTNEWAGYSIEIMEGTGKGLVLVIISNTATSLLINVPFGVVFDAGSVFRIYFEDAQGRSVSDDLYGTDIFIGADHGLAVTPGGDIASVGGLLNFEQALNSMMDTDPGDLPLHPGYGFNKNIGRRGTVESLFLLRVSAEQTLRSDTRVSSIKSLSITQELDASRLSAYIIPKGSALGTALSKSY